MYNIWFFLWKKFIRYFKFKYIIIFLQGFDLKYSFSIELMSFVIFTAKNLHHKNGTFIAEIQEFGGLLNFLTK